MSALEESTAKKLARLFRMFGSSFENERHIALTKMQQTLEAAHLSFNDIAVLIENHGGEIEERKYSDADAEIIFAKGMEKGRVEEARKQQAPPEFYDCDGEPRWYEIAVFCQQNSRQLRDKWQQDFANDIPAKILQYGKPTERQKPHLLGIFVKLGGRYVPKK
jgi:hypothetical protein